MDKVVRVLNLKMGIATEDEVPLATARKQYEAGFKNQVPDAAIQAIAKLCKLNMPCLDAANNALIAMAGAGGTEFALSVDQEILI